MRYYLVENRENEYYCTEFPTEEEAFNFASLTWDKYLTPWDKKRIIEYFVGAMPDNIDGFSYDELEIIKSWR